MATLKNPSIYEDRSTIGSADELDEYGVWVKIEPEELSAADADNFPDFDADFGPELSPDEISDNDAAAFEDFSYSGDGEEADFDDVEALRQDIEPFPPAEPAIDAATEQAADKPGAAADLSTQLLMKIADELSSIKDELSTLKGELSVLRSEKTAGGDTEDAGFFDEDDDDKIALTGDELDNIIHTADFTEETGFDAGASLAEDFAEPEAPPSPSNDDAGIIYDGLGRPLQAASPDSGGSPAEPAAPAPVAEDFDSGGAEIIYDGLGRPLNRKISEDAGASLDAPLELKDSGDLKTLQENGVEPMTAAPDDTSYLEEDPLAEELFNLSDAIIDEPDLSEAIRDAPLEEPSLDKLSLIDLDNISEPPDVKDEEAAGDKPFFEDITFEDLPDLKDPLEAESIPDTANLEEEETIDLSVFEDELLLENDDSLDGPAADDGELSFEVLDEDAELPVQGNVQDNVITEDSFESISFDDDGAIDEVRVDEDPEQPLPDDFNIELDLPSLEIDGVVENAKTGGDENFSLPGSADIAEAGDTATSTAEVTPAIKMGLRDVLIYMDKLLESLPEEKINEFAQSEHYTTYKKLFEELDIH
jgi:hypothetical protein